MDKEIQRNQIKIDFDLGKKIFWLSIPIFSSRFDLSQSIKNYVDARKNLTFKPHKTSFQIDKNKVFLTQEFPFSLQENLRKQVDRFWQMSQWCHRMFSEMAAEEKCKEAFFVLDCHLEE